MGEWNEISRRHPYERYGKIPDHAARVESYKRQGVCITGSCESLIRENHNSYSIGVVSRAGVVSREVTVGKGTLSHVRYIRERWNPLSMVARQPCNVIVCSRETCRQSCREMIGREPWDKDNKGKHGAKMHVLANGAERNLSSTMLNHLK